MRTFLTVTALAVLLSACSTVPADPNKPPAQHAQKSAHQQHYPQK